MIVIGLTGGIGTGKSTIASQFAALGAKISCADDIVHTLLGPRGTAVEAVGKAFPGVVKNGQVDRKKLGDIVFSDEKKRKKLEAVLHPMVIVAEERFVRRQQQNGVKLVVLDIPLLFEAHQENRFDLVVVAKAPLFLQRQRVLKRANMTKEKLAAIIATQMPEQEKARRADCVIETGLGKAHSFRAVAALMKELQ